MSETTNLKLFKHDNVETNENQFDINKALNQNWNKIDGFAGIVSDTLENKVDKIENKDLSTNDFTNEYKRKLDNLNNYNDTQIKSDIENIKQKDIAQDKKILSLETDNTQNKTHISNIKAEQITQNTSIEENTNNIATANEEIAELQEKYNNMKKQLPERTSKWRICAFE